MPDIVIAGATFRGVPQIDIPKEGSGTASFIYEDGTKQITQNGTGIDVSGYAAVDVAVPSSSPVIQSLSVTQNGEYTAPSGVDGYSPVTVNVSGGDEPIPQDGKTRVWIHIDEDTPQNRLTFFLCYEFSKANNSLIDWGDGTVTQGSTGGTPINQHTYAQGGDYVITITVTEGTISIYGTSGTNAHSIYGSRANSNAHNRGRIKKVILGSHVNGIDNYAFEHCYALESIVIPNSVLNIGASAFYNCYALKEFVIPSEIETMTSFVIGTGNYSVQRITIPEGVKTLESSAIRDCYGLTSLTIPSTVTSIGDYNFYNCYGVSEYHMKPLNPPSLNRAFSNIASDCIIYVPYSADHSILNAYKTAQNWSAQASKMMEESA